VTQARARPVLLALVVVGLLGATGLTALTLVTEQHSRPSASPAASSTVAPSAPGLPVPVTAVQGYRGAPYDASSIHRPTADEGQSRIWTAEGAWWAVLEAGRGPETHIFRLDEATQVWQDTGTIVDDRTQSRADVRWDGSRLVIAASVDSATRAAPTVVGAFVYDAAVRRFRPVPDSPVAIDAAPGRAVLAREAAGGWWLVVLRAATLRVLHSAADALHWSTPSAIPGAADGSIVAAAATTDGDGVSIVYSVAGSPAIRIAHHPGGAADAPWVTATAPIPDFGVAPAALSVTVAGPGPGARLVVAARGPADRGAGVNVLASQIVVLARDRNGSWRVGVVAQIRDHPGPPAVIADPAGRVVSVFYALPSGGGSIEWKQAPIDTLAFETGPGEPVIATTADPKVDAPNLPRTPLDPTTGIVVLASDDQAGEYVHAVVGGNIAALPPARLAPGALTLAKPGALPKASVIVADDTFSSSRSAPIPWWSVEGRSNGRGSLSIVDAGGSDLALRLETSTPIGSARACRSIVPTATGRIGVTGLFRLSSIGATDTEVMALRGPGGEIASARVTRHGLAAYYSGSAKVTTTVHVAAQTWYRLRMIVDLRTKRYSWRLDRVGGSVVLQTVSARWRQPKVTAAESVCLSTPEKSPSSTIDLTTLLVERVS
jgi:hypothetical protein